MKYPVLRTRARRRSPSRCRAPHILALATLASTLGVISVVLHWPRGLVSQLAVAPDLSSPPPPSPSLSTSLTPRRPPPHVDTPGAYVLVSFKNGEVLGDGLRLLVSRDARRWHALPNEPLVLPLEQTGGKVFRDPSILWWQGAFHLVWSSDLCVGQVPGKWQCKGLKGKKRPAARFGYATSTDLVNWRDVQLVELKLRDACSLWAPELSELPADEGGGVMLSFSATVVKGECPANFKRTRHRAMFVTSMDMRRWSKPLPLLEAEAESVIDLFPLLAAQPREAPDGGDDPARRHVLLYKTEYNGCDARRWTAGVLPRSANGSCTLVLRQATARTARGPWTPDKRASGGFFPGAISRPCVEGASALRLGPRRYAALFDAYRTDCEIVAPPPCSLLDGAPPARSGMRLLAEGPAAGGQCVFEPARKGFGGMVSDDVLRWTDTSESFEVPDDYKHGTALALNREARNAVCLPPPGGGGGGGAVDLTSSELCRGAEEAEEAAGTQAGTQAGTAAAAGAVKAAAKAKGRRKGKGRGKGKV